MSPEKSGFPTKARTLVRKEKPTECCKHAPMLPSNSSLLVLIFSSYVLSNTGGEKEWSSIQQQGKGVLGMRLNQLALEDAAL